MTQTRKPRSFATEERKAIETKKAIRKSQKKNKSFIIQFVLFFILMDM